jgi:lipopolysaccharide export LptBFGC system permease protein LptF
MRVGTWDVGTKTIKADGTWELMRVAWTAQSASNQQKRTNQLKVDEKWQELQLSSSFDPPHLLTNVAGFLPRDQDVSS